MPIITRPDGSRLADAAAIDTIIGALGLTLRRVAPPFSTALADVLADHHLDDARTNAILDDYESVLGDGHAGRDVVALFPGTPGLDGILVGFAQAHRHRDAETRLILAGGGAFGFVLSDGAQVEIAVGPGDLILVPPGLEHWFRLSDARTLVAVRLFQANPDWRADYTGTPNQFLTSETTRTLHD